MNYNRLDDRYIDDEILRGLFHREVIARADSYHDDNTPYTIKLDETYRADLAAYRAYGIQDLRWVFRLLAGHESEFEALPVGTTLTLPDMTWLRNRIRDYAGDKPEIAQDE